MDFSKTIPHGFFQGVNPRGISCSKGFTLHRIPPRNLLLFSTDLQVPAKIQLQDELPSWTRHGILGISTPAPRNHLQSRFFAKFPLWNSICASIGFFQLNSYSRGVAAVPDGIGRTGEKLLEASCGIQPRSLTEFWPCKANPDGKTPGWAGKIMKWGGKTPG